MGGRVWIQQLQQQHRSSFLDDRMSRFKLRFIIIIIIIIYLPRVCKSNNNNRLWNSLPADLRQADISFEQFKRLLKTFLFGCWDRGAL